MVHNIEAIKRVHSPKYVTQLLPLSLFISFQQACIVCDVLSVCFSLLLMNYWINILCQEEEE